MRMGKARDWANLPGELAHLIADKLPPDLIYVLAFRAVCKNWRFSVPLSHLPPQLPWIIQQDTNPRFYSLAGGDTGTITVPMPDRDDLVCHGPSHGYLFLSSSEKKNESWLLNPLNGHLIMLPLLDHGFGISAAVYGSMDLTNNTWHVLCRWPSRNHDQHYTVAIYRANENAWKYMEIDFHPFWLNSSCCWDGKLFAMDTKHFTRVFDVVSGKYLYEVPPMGDGEDEFPPDYLLVRKDHILSSHVKRFWELNIYGQTADFMKSYNSLCFIFMNFILKVGSILGFRFLISAIKWYFWMGAVASPMASP